METQLPDGDEVPRWFRSIERYAWLALAVAFAGFLVIIMVRRLPSIGRLSSPVASLALAGLCLGALSRASRRHDSRQTILIVGSGLFLLAAAALGWLKS